MLSKEEHEKAVNEIAHKVLEDTDVPSEAYGVLETAKIAIAQAINEIKILRVDTKEGSENAEEKE